MESTQTLTLAEAYAFLEVSEKSLRNYCKARKLPFHKVKNARGVWEYRFKLNDLKEFKARRSRATPEEKTPPSKSQESISGIDDKSNAGMITGIIPDKNLGTTTPTPAGITPETVLRDALLRQLFTENAFLREQLVERDRQLSLKDRQIERQLERMSGLNDSLTALAQEMLKR